MVREGGLCTSPGSSAIPPHRAGDSGGRWRCQYRVQESELGGGVASRVVGKLAQVWSTLLQDAFSKPFRSGVPSTTMGQSHVWRLHKCNRKGRGGCDSPSFENCTLSIGGPGWRSRAPNPGNQGVGHSLLVLHRLPRRSRDPGHRCHQLRQAGRGPGWIVSWLPRVRCQ